jgi:hypothetical protein
MVLGYLMEASRGLRKHVLNGIEADEPQLASKKKKTTSYAPETDGLSLNRSTALWTQYVGDLHRVSDAENRF